MEWISRFMTISKTFWNSRLRTEKLKSESDLETGIGEAGETKLLGWYQEKVKLRNCEIKPEWDNGWSHERLIHCGNKME